MLGYSVGKQFRRALGEFWLSQAIPFHLPSLTQYIKPYLSDLLPFLHRKPDILNPLLSPKALSQ